MWVRGLKQGAESTDNADTLSHPMWVRGLKQVVLFLEKCLILVAPYVGAWIETDAEYQMRMENLKVAPYVGAWIETRRRGRTFAKGRVAPYVGAWIETTVLRHEHSDYSVAPYVGAWIETVNGFKLFTSSKSHPMWVRGLKL